MPFYVGADQEIGDDSAVFSAAVQIAGVVGSREHSDLLGRGEEIDAEIRKELFERGIRREGRADFRNHAFAGYEPPFSDNPAGPGEEQICDMHISGDSMNGTMPLKASILILCISLLLNCVLMPGAAVFPEIKPIADDAFVKVPGDSLQFWSGLMTRETVERYKAIGYLTFCNRFLADTLGTCIDKDLYMKIFPGGVHPPNAYARNGKPIPIYSISALPHSPSGRSRS